jgi:hypothetical protein
MSVIRTRIHVDEDGTLTGRVSPALASDHEAEIQLSPPVDIPTQEWRRKKPGCFANARPDESPTFPHPTAAAKIRI